MSVILSDGGAIELQGVCPVDDAEVLLRYLLDNPDAVVDWSRCERAHTAVVQVLLASASAVVGHPADPFLVDYVAPSLAGK